VEKGRLHAKAATIENGFVWLPEAAPWLADDLAELLAFPGRPPRPSIFL
jgi:phage terminase large subunit-like protein